MQIKDLCIGDGKIDKYKYDGKDLIMVFTDYNSQKYEIVLNSCYFIEVVGSIGFSLSEGKYRSNEEGDSWELFDEDGENMKIGFRGHSVKQL